MRRMFALAVFLTAALLGGALPASASAAMPYCGISWGSLDKSLDYPNTGSAQLTNVRTGQHACYDRVVFDFSLSVAHYSIGYRKEVLTQGRGEALTVKGGAKLDVEIGEHAENTYQHPVGPPFGPPLSNINVSGYRTLRDVVYGGTSEGHTTFGVGVRARLPFQVFILAGPNAGQSRLVMDVAHQWSQ